MSDISIRISLQDDASAAMNSMSSIIFGRLNSLVKAGLLSSSQFSGAMALNTSSITGWANSMAGAYAAMNDSTEGNLGLLNTRFQDLGLAMAQAGEAGRNAAGDIAGSFATAGSALGSLNGIFATTLTGLSQSAGNFSTMLNGLFSGFGAGNLGLPSASGSASGSGGGSNLVSSLLGMVPHFAQGGIVNRPTFALVGESGPEAIIPLSRHATRRSMPLLPGAESGKYKIGTGGVFKIDETGNQSRPGFMKVFDDMIWRPGHSPIGISPEDTLLAFKSKLPVPNEQAMEGPFQPHTGSGTTISISSININAGTYEGGQQAARGLKEELMRRGVQFTR